MRECRPPWYRRGWMPFWLSFGISLITVFGLTMLVLRLLQ